MQKVSWCDFKGLEYTLSQGWVITNILLNERALKMAGSAPFFVVFDIPEPKPEPGPEPEPEPEPMQKPQPKPRPAIRESFADMVDKFGFYSLLILWGFFVGLIVMAIATKR